MTESTRNIDTKSIRVVLYDLLFFLWQIFEAKSMRWCLKLTTFKKLQGL
jgi:hypothetical protein